MRHKVKSTPPTHILVWYMGICNIKFVANILIFLALEQFVSEQFDKLGNYLLDNIYSDKT